MISSSLLLFDISISRLAFPGGEEHRIRLRNERDEAEVLVLVVDDGTLDTRAGSEFDTLGAHDGVACCNCNRLGELHGKYAGHLVPHEEHDGVQQLRTQVRRDVYTRTGELSVCGEHIGAGNTDVRERRVAIVSFIEAVRELVVVSSSLDWKFVVPHLQPDVAHANPRQRLPIVQRTYRDDKQVRTELFLSNDQLRHHDGMSR